MIFSTFLKKHLTHLRFVFSTFEKINIYLLSQKSFFDYPFVQLLNQKIDVLKLTTAEEKLIIIINLFFSKTLAQLKKYLDFIEYLR